jgi:hypothetical protein
MDRLDLGLRRELLSLEAVDADDGIGPRQFLQLPLQFGRIVGERVDLGLRHFVPELR